MKILVIVDMQNDFITGPLGTPEAQAIVPKVCELIRTGGYDEICYTKDTHDTDYLNTHEGQWLQIEHCMNGTHGWEYEQSVKDELRHLILQRAVDYTDGKRKNIGVSAFPKRTFASNSLSNHLAFERGCEKKDIERIDICGVCTNICVISNALLIRTALPETDITVIADACAGTTPEMHQKALDVMKSCHITLRWPND